MRLIQQLYAAGLSSKIIVELMPSVIDGRATSTLVKRLAVEREHVDRRITDLMHVRDRLDSVIAAATTNMVTGTSCRQEVDA